MDWKERGWSGKNANMVEGIVKTVTGEPRWRMRGRFTESVTLLDLTDPNAKEEIIYTIAQRPENSESMYNFSYYAL